jgi:hypothetical protein
VFWGYVVAVDNQIAAVIAAADPDTNGLSQQTHDLLSINYGENLQFAV